MSFIIYISYNIHTGYTPSQVPLKRDWTKVCPLNLTLEERYEKCKLKSCMNGFVIVNSLSFNNRFDVLIAHNMTGISLQEGIYGTKLLKRLEAIKVDVDPNFMFDCFGCIGNNWPDKARARSKSLLRGRRLEHSVVME